MSYSRITWENGATALSAENMNRIEDGIEEALDKESIWEYVSNLVFPVGSIYMSATLDTVEKVSAALGGTWVKWGEGRVPVGVDSSNTIFDTAEETGGNANAIVPSHNHTFTGNAMGTHNHTQNSHNHTQAAHNHGLSKYSGEDRSFVTIDAGISIGHDNKDKESGNEIRTPYVDIDSFGFRSASNTANATATNNAVTATNNAASAGTPSGTISTVGTSVTNANLQPYITCYMYKRTA